MPSPIWRSFLLNREICGVRHELRWAALYRIAARRWWERFVLGTGRIDRFFEVTSHDENPR